MAATLLKPIRAKVFRLTRLDSCGGVAVGSRSSIVTSSFVKVENSPQFVDGQETEKKNANGDLCLYDKSAPKIKTVQLTITLCTEDPDVVEMLTGARVLASSGGTGMPASGTSIGIAVGQSLGTTRFGLETWQEAQGACSSPQPWIYSVLPHIVNGVLGDFNFEEPPMELTITAETREPGSGWGDGPYGSALYPSINSDEHWLQTYTVQQPPTAAVGAVALSAIV